MLRIYVTNSSRNSGRDCIPTQSPDLIGRTRYKLSRIPILALFILIPTLLHAQQKLPKDIRWVRQSIEYAAICEQTYRAAWQSVKTMAAEMDEHWAVVLDVDETVLDNSQYQVEIFRKGESFSPKTWAAWVKREEAGVVPGVKTFLDNVRALGEFAHIVFITNRDADMEQATISNMKKLGLWQDGDVILGRRERSDTKEIRRQEVINGTGRCEGLGTRKIIALIGDQIGDLREEDDAESVDALKKSLLDSNALGVKYFVLPNPMYGSWERR